MLGPVIIDLVPTLVPKIFQCANLCFIFQCISDVPEEFRENSWLSTLAARSTKRQFRGLHDRCSYLPSSITRLVLVSSNPIRGVLACRHLYRQSARRKAVIGVTSKFLRQYLSCDARSWRGCSISPVSPHFDTSPMTGTRRSARGTCF